MYSIRPKICLSPFHSSVSDSRNSQQTWKNEGKACPPSGFVNCYFVIHKKLVA